jgi:hypothetical protein
MAHGHAHNSDRGTSTGQGHLVEHNDILHFDCFSGLSGDMILASLLDLGLPLEVVESAVAKLPLRHYRIRV